MTTPYTTIPDSFPVVHPLRSRVASKLYHNLRDARRQNVFIEHLGCSAITFRVYMEALFAPGMTWANHGKWHIDHIIPLAFAGADGGPPSLSETVARLHYTNTQPLWARDNIAKLNRWIGGAVAPSLPTIEEDCDIVMVEEPGIVSIEIESVNAESFANQFAARLTFS